MESLFRERIFVAAVESENFSEAGRRLGLSPSTISKQISELEGRYGARLFERSTRRVRPTAAGRRFYNRCIKILEELQIAEDELIGAHSEPRGTLRFTAPDLFTNRYIVPFLMEFTGRYPKIDLDVKLKSPYARIDEEQVDLIIDSVIDVERSIPANALATDDVICCAAPSYLKTHGEPTQPDDLNQHNCLRLVGGKFEDWWMKGPHGLQAIRVSGNIVSDNPEVVRQLVISGAGVALLSNYLVVEDLRTGALVEVLGKYRTLSKAIVARPPEGRQLTLNAQVFIEFLREKLAPSALRTHLPTVEWGTVETDRMAV